MDKIKNIGVSDWFKNHLDENKLAVHELARVVSVHKDSYMISNNNKDVFAELSGNLHYSVESAADLPTVGDWVYADFYDDDTHAIIHGVLPRRTILKRKTAGKLVEFQLIAANIDTAFIVQSVNENFNLSRLERYLVMVNESGITPVILLSKTDLLPQSEIEELTTSIIAANPDIAVIPFSNETGENLDNIQSLLTQGSTYCLLGSSGVGKTTLLNSIIGTAKLETQAVSKKQSKGRHTTTIRDLLQLENGAMIIDTPGMRELANMSVDTGIEETFSEIIELMQHCKFSNCSHTKEKVCAILTALETGELSEQRFKNYQKMKNESAFNDMSYSDKRKKDKAFGMLIKTTLKNKKR